MTAANPIPTADICDQHEDNNDDITIVAPLFRNFGKIRCFAGSIVTLHCADDNSKVREQPTVSGLSHALDAHCQRYNKKPNIALRCPKTRHITHS